MSPSRPSLHGPLIVLTLIAVIFAGCSTAASPTPAPSATPAPTAAPTAAPTPTPTPVAAFPTTLTDDEGTSVALAAEPTKIVSLTPAATETLFKLGVGDRVVAKVEDVANFPPEAADLPVVATFEGVDTEKIVGLGADLVIAGGNFGTNPDAVAKLRSVGVPVLVVYAPDVAGALRDIELIGSAVGKADAAKDLRASMQAGFDQISAATASLPKPRVFYETGTFDKAIYGIADDSVYAEMLTLAGAEPVTTGSATDWEMSTEKIIAGDPEIIVLGDAAYGVTAETIADRPGWEVLSAVKAGSIVPVDDIVVTRPGPRLVDGLLVLTKAVHPDAVLPSLAPASP